MKRLILPLEAGILFIGLGLLFPVTFLHAQEGESFTLEAEGGLNDGQPMVEDEDVIEDPAQAEPEGQAELDFTNARDVMYDAMVDVQDEDYETAIPKLEWVIEQDPTLLGAWETLGWAYWLTGREEDANELWTQLVEIAPNEPMGYNLLGQVATRDTEFERALELYERSLELNPAQFEVRVSRAQVLLWSGEEADAIQELNQLLREDEERIDIQIDLAWALYGDEQYEDSLEHWNEILDAIPGHPGFLLARANVHLLMGMLPEAAADARACLEVEPENLAAMNLLIALSIRNNRPYQTVDRLNELLEQTEGRENKIRVAQQIAVFMQSVHEESPGIFSRQEVIDASRDAWDLDRDNVASALFYGEVLLQGLNFLQAEDVFEHVIEKLNPNNERARYGLLESYLGQSRLHDAERQLVENLRAFNGENPYRHIYWTRIHFARGDFQLALRALERLEREGARGSVYHLKYDGISPSEFADVPSVRQLREHVMALRRDGFEFMVPSELGPYFESLEEPPVADLDRPWLNKVVEGVKYSWTAEKPDMPDVLEDFVPDKRVVISFDGGLRNSFRHATQVANEVDAKFAMFVPVGDVLSRSQRYIARFPEIQDYKATGRWELQSYLWEAQNLIKTEENAEAANRLALPNRKWLEDRGRMETLKEYQDRLRKEFSESKEVLARELELSPDEINTVAYPFGDVGQEHTTNIELFDVISVILNEAEIAYKQGYIQYRFGYAMKADNPLIWKRFKPNRQASGRFVLRQAYLQHPVYLARKMRAEVAALQGKYDLAMKNVELLRRDGFPEEDLRELTEYVDRNLARLVRLPDAVEDTANEEETLEANNWIQPQDPYIGVDGRSVRANEVIDEREFGVFAGVNLNRKMSFQARASFGEIEQSFNTRTNRTFEVFQSTTGSTSRNVTRIVEGRPITARETTSFTETFSFGSNSVDQVKFKADFQRYEGQFSYIHDSGAFTIARAGIFKLDLIDRRREESEITFGIEHQWRPFPNLDFVAAYNHGVVPSARELVSYDQVAFRPIWRVRDWWHATGVGVFSFYNDDNSYVHTEVENLFLLSEKLDIWGGLHSSISTTDEDSDLYWSPFWEQRHFLVLEIRRNYPKLSTSFRGHLGFQKERARDEEIQEYLNLVATAAEQGGFSAGEPPDEGWNKLLGFSANISRTWKNGFEVNGAFLVNATNEYIEHNVIGSLLYRF